MNWIAVLKNEPKLPGTEPATGRYPYQYDDAGAEGTKGFTEEVVTLDRIMKAPRQGTLPYPVDPVNFRMNIGVRTFDAGATIAFERWANDGTFRATTTKTYGANFFEQFNAASLGSTDGWIVVYVTSGSAVVYGSYTDNRTNDSNIRYAHAP